MTFFARVGPPGIYCLIRRHNINVGVCGNRRLRCEATRSYEAAWASRAVEGGTRIHAKVKVKRSSESKGYTSPEGLQEQMLFDGVRSSSNLYVKEDYEMILEAILSEKGPIVGCHFSVMDLTTDDNDICVSLAPYV